LLLLADSIVLAALHRWSRFAASEFAPADHERHTVTSEETAEPAEQRVELRHVAAGAAHGTSRPRTRDHRAVVAKWRDEHRKVMIGGCYRRDRSAVGER